MDIFLILHQRYNYDRLCNEIKTIQKGIEELVDDYFSRVSQIYYRFHDNDRPLKEELIEL